VLLSPSDAVVERVVSIADTYRAMSDDIKRAAKETDDEGVRRAYLALAELWRKATLRAEGFSIPADQCVIPD
jgi:hypothetical protein